MKIVHVSASAPYNDYWGYQDNLLPKYHKKMGHDVYIITTNTKHQAGKIVDVPCEEYCLNDGVHVIRKKHKKYPLQVLNGLRSKLDIYDKLVEIHPDFIFFHGLSSATIEDVIRYKKIDNFSCVVVQDNHLDYNIGLKFSTLKEKIIRAYHRYENKKSISYVDKVYGVTPWRKTYAEDYFGIPAKKTDVLIMGADDEKIELNNKDIYRTALRKKYNISENEFLVVTGGKIDKKKNIDLLMRACTEIKDIKLLVFGNVLKEVENDFDRLLKNSNNIIYIGWIDADDVYKYFFAADLVFFPGQHSVLWEQACASKVPCVFEKWIGMDHVNNGGNSDFIYPVNVQAIKAKIDELKFTDKYYEMKKVAESQNTDIYLYSKIAAKSLECVKNKLHRK